MLKCFRNNNEFDKGRPNQRSRDQEVIKDDEWARIPARGAATSGEQREVGEDRQLSKL